MATSGNTTSHFFNVVFDPFLVDGDVTFEEMKTWLVHEVSDAVTLHVHAIHFPIGGVEDALA